MGFFDNTRNFGILITLLSVISLAIAVFNIIDKGFESKELTMLESIGLVLTNAVLILAGITIFSQTDGGIISFAFPEGSSSKFGALTGYIFATGLANILSLTIPGIVFGIIFVLVGWTITNKRKTIVDTIIWIILVILFGITGILGLVGGVLTFGDSVLLGVQAVIASLLELTAFLYLLDSDVKSKFGS